jgi:hypothetical protein
MIPEGVLYFIKYVMLDFVHIELELAFLLFWYCSGSDMHAWALQLWFVAVIIVHLSQQHSNNVCMLTARHGWAPIDQCLAKAAFSTALRSLALAVLVHSLVSKVRFC